MIANIDWDKIFIGERSIIRLIVENDSRRYESIESLISDKDLEVNPDRHTEFVNKMEKGKGFEWEIQ